MINDVWKPVYEHEGFYEVSNTGRVRGVDRVVNLADGRTRRIKEKILSPKRNADGYWFVTLSRDAVSQTRYLHRLVAEAFIPNPGGLPEVNHISGSKDDNTVGNLEWVTHQQNVQHAYDNGMSCNVGSSHKFSVGVVDNYIGRTFETIKEWCAARGINYSTGRNLLNGLNKSKTIDLTGVVKISKTNE